jgi:hypothetical protein
VPARRVTPARAAAPHPFVEDADVPADFWGRKHCTTCRLPGKPGDTRHLSDEPAPAPPVRQLPPDVAEEYRARDAAILGERD